MWSSAGIARIRDVKKSVLKKKIMLGFIIDSNSWKDRMFRWTHIFLALVSPVLIAVQDQGTLCDTGNPLIPVALGIVVAGMLKLKEYLEYDKLRDTAKEQTVRYGDLFDRIENEIVKPDEKKQIDSDFIYWIIREYNSIGMSDPELSNSEKKAFVQLCKDRNIPCDEDIDVLELLVRDTTPDSKNDNKNHVVSNIESHADTSGVSSVKKSPVAVSGNNSVSIDTITAKDRQKYRETLKKIDTKADIQWAMDRLNDLG